MSDDDDEEARKRLVGEISRLETEEDSGGGMNPAGKQDSDADAYARSRKGRKTRRALGREGPCSQLCIFVVNLEQKLSRPIMATVTIHCAPHGRRHGPLVDHM